MVAVAFPVLLRFSKVKSLISASHAFRALRRAPDAGESFGRQIRASG
jgi:hypothetical protein